MHSFKPYCALNDGDLKFGKHSAFFNNFRWNSTTCAAHNLKYLTHHGGGTL